MDRRVMLGSRYQVYTWMTEAAIREAIRRGPIKLSNETGVMSALGLYDEGGTATFWYLVYTGGTAERSIAVFARPTPDATSTGSTAINYVGFYRSRAVGRWCHIPREVTAEIGLIENRLGMLGTDTYLDTISWHARLCGILFEEH
jgi:hypothetical protein